MIHGCKSRPNAAVRSVSPRVRAATMAWWAVRERCAADVSGSVGVLAFSHLYQAFEQWRRSALPMAWVTVIETEGSTYSKPGEQMLIGPDEQFQGLLSGGCLEGELLDHARQVLADGRPQRLFYDMRDVVADELWGLGLGCDGALSIFMQRLVPELDYEPFASLARWAWEGAGGTWAVVVSPKSAAGASLRCGEQGCVALGLDTAQADVLARQLDGLEGPVLRELSLPGGQAGVFMAPAQPVPRLLVIGAGPDAGPLASMALQLGWRVWVVDYREAALARLQASPERALCLEPGQLAAGLQLDRFHAAVVMTHNQARDREYLRALAGSCIPYVGLLGPASRRDRLMTEIGEAGTRLAGRVYGPVGLDLGGRGPELIALSILAQVQAALAGRCGPQDRGLPG